MLLLLILIGFGYAEKSVLIIGGDQHSQSPGPTVEQFFTSNMTSRVISTIDLPNVSSRNSRDFTPRVHVTPVNFTHAFLLVGLSTKSFFIDQQGHLTPGPTADKMICPGLTYISGENGQMRPIYCGRVVVTGGDVDVRKDCKVMSADGKFKPHSRMIGESQEHWCFTLLTFGDELFAISGDTVQRYNGTAWEMREPSGHESYSAVKLNETALLSCGPFLSYDLLCFVYHVDEDLWTPAPTMKKNGYNPEMVLIGQTVYAFDRHGYLPNDGNTIQTLNLTDGFGKAKWKIANKKLEKQRLDFGVWVIDSAWNGPVETTTSLPSNKFGIQSSDEPPTTTLPNTPSSQLLTAGSIMFLIYNLAFWLVLAPMPYLLLTIILHSYRSHVSERREYSKFLLENVLFEFVDAEIMIEFAWRSDIAKDYTGLINTLTVLAAMTLLGPTAAFVCNTDCVCNTNNLRYFQHLRGQEEQRMT